jgi:uncharacterized Zn-finger protein
LKAVKVQNDLWSQHNQKTDGVKTIRLSNPVGLVNSKKKTTVAKPTKATISAALQKLKGTSLTVKKVKDPIKYEFDEEFFFKPAEVIIKEEPHTEDYDSDGGYNDNFNNYDDEDDDDYYQPSTSKKKKTSSATASTSAAPKGINPSKKNIDKVIQLDCPAVYVCMACKSRFKSFEELKAHMDSSSDCINSNLKCEQCGKICTNRKHLYSHRLTHVPKETHICDQCGKSYTNSFNLENHKSQVHGEDLYEVGCIYKCKDCDATFEGRKDLYKHMEDHKNEVLNLLCDNCGKCFHSQESLRSHQRVHLDIKPFACDVSIY